MNAPVRASRFKQSDLVRAIKAAEAAGMRVGRFEIDPNGRIVVFRANAADLSGPNEWDDVLR